MLTLSRPDDFAIVIVIGGRCRFFHQGNLVELLQTIKPLSKCPGLEPGDVYLPRVVEDGSELDYWMQAGISIDAVRESIHQGWEPIFEVSHGGNIVPANVHDLDHRSSISEGFTWMANIAATRGTRDDRYW